MAVGDVNSDEKGSGARYNDGKMSYNMIPVDQWPLLWETEDVPDNTIYLILELVYLLGKWQQGDDSKIREALHLVGKTWHEEIANVFDYGANKYAAWNWAKGMDWSIPLGCIGRHLEAIVNGQDIDPESGEHHMGHIGCNLVMLVHYANYYVAGDDRPPRNVFVNEAVFPDGGHDDQLDALRFLEGHAAELGMRRETLVTAKERLENV